MINIRRTLLVIDFHTMLLIFIGIFLFRESPKSAAEIFAIWRVQTQPRLPLLRSAQNIFPASKFFRTLVAEPPTIIAFNQTKRSDQRQTRIQRPGRINPGEINAVCEMRKGLGLCLDFARFFFPLCLWIEFIPFAWSVKNNQL